MADRPYNQYGTTHYSEEKWDQILWWLRSQLEEHKKALGDHMGYTRKLPIQVTKPAELTPQRKREAPQLQQDLPGTASPPPALGPGWWQ